MNHEAMNNLVVAVKQNKATAEFADELVEFMEENKKTVENDEMGDEHGMSSGDEEHEMKDTSSEDHVKESESVELNSGKEAQSSLDATSVYAEFQKAPSTVGEAQKILAESFK